jgi:hypothetical protein
MLAGVFLDRGKPAATQSDRFTDSTRLSRALALVGGLPSRVALEENQRLQRLSLAATGASTSPAGLLSALKL